MSKQKFEFVIPETHMVDPAEYREKRYLECPIEILSGPLFGNKSYRFKGRLPTCCASFVFVGEWSVDNKAKTVRPTNGAAIKTRKRNPKRITEYDVRFFIREMELTSPELADNRAQLLACGGMEVSRFIALPFFAAMHIEQHCDYFRLEYEAILYTAFVHTYKTKVYFDNDQEDIIRQMKPAQLKELHDKLTKQPWLFCFERHTGPLKPMRYINFQTVRLELKRNIPPFIDLALRVYAYLQDERDKGHTIFEVASLFKGYLEDTDKWGRIAYDYNDTMERWEKSPDSLNFLIHHGLVLLPDNQYVCFHKDLRSDTALLEVLDNLSDDEPVERPDWGIPCLLKGELSDVQQQVVQHVVRNKLTLLEGGPGTGKTEVLVAMMARFQAPLVVTYVGMMVEQLQLRFNGRVETAHTIHSVCCIAEHVKPEGQAWLNKFDIVIIDEASNVDARLLSRFMSHLGHACRLVLVGDLGQIFPIKAGCPFYDLVRCFPQHSFMLLENKRVDPDAKALADASQLIRNGRVCDAPFTTDGPLRILHRPVDAEQQYALIEHVVTSYCSRSEDVMSMQFVTFRNADRKMLNQMIEQALLKYRILRSTGARSIGAGFEIFTGKKISFTKNIKPLKTYAGVRNGEMGQVSKFTQRKDGWEIELTNKKKVFVSQNVKGAIPPHCLQAGYATTCNKAQGSEWERVLFWIYENPSSFFTREFPYVAMSRAKKRCMVVGHPQELQRVCAARAKERNTLFRYLLGTTPLTAIRNLEPFDDVPRCNFAGKKLLPSGIPVVPIMVKRVEGESAAVLW
jgi:hypothetical protein